MPERQTAELARDARLPRSFDESTAEHISLGDDFAERSEAARTVSDRVTVRDALRGRETLMTFYRQGFLEVVERRGGKSARCVPIDLRYLDPTPSIDRRYPIRLLRITGIVAAVAVTVTGLAAAGIGTPWTSTAAAAAIALAVVLAIGCFYSSHEEIRFYTLHGRAMTLRLRAGLGCIGRYRKLLPKVVAAIETAADSIGEDTTLYLRQEMREHYRLRSAGVLTDAECADSTSRILTQFEEPR